MNDTVFYKIMIFYALVTFFAGPKIAKMMKLDTNDPCMVGMVGGFLISLLLWNKFGYDMVYKGKKGY